MKQALLTFIVIFFSVASQGGWLDESTLQDLTNKKLSFDSDVDLIKHLNTLNQKINRIIQYSAEELTQDVWQPAEQTFNLKKGDCEDYALLKYYILRKTIPQNIIMRLGFVRTKPDNESHMVLLLRTSPTADFLVLDNLVDPVLPLKERHDLWLFMSIDEENQYRNDSEEILPFYNSNKKFKIFLNQ
jgi:predicted transglutaminase-like cysteine proteinase